MDIYLTLDYELFFGEQSGTPEHCIIKPTQDLLSILDPLDIKATFLQQQVFGGFQRMVIG